jgi:hypothetical protein
MTKAERNYANALKFEQKAARWLHEANLAAEAGDKERAEKLYAKCQYWLDKMNVALGNGDGND